MQQQLQNSKAKVKAMNTTTNTEQTTQHADYATAVLEQVLAVVEGSFYNLRDDVLNADQLFEMRIRLQDAADEIAEACRHIELVQRAVEQDTVQ
jgi:hypothetical protein